MARNAPASDKEARKANKRGAARLAAVQALYQMDLAGSGLNEILAEFEKHWIGREVEGAQYLPAEKAFLRTSSPACARAARARSLIDEALADRWPLKRIETVLRAMLRRGAYELGHRRDVPARGGRLGICRRRRPPSSSATRSAWSMPCSISSRTACALASQQSA